MGPRNGADANSCVGALPHPCGATRPNLQPMPVPHLSSVFIVNPSMNETRASFAGRCQTDGASPYAGSTAAASPLAAKPGTHHHTPAHALAMAPQSGVAVPSTLRA